jgi:hypothetical protein
MLYSGCSRAGVLQRYARHSSAAAPGAQVISLWLWLSLRFEEHFFPGREQISALNRQLITWMNEGLTSAADAEAEEAQAQGAVGSPLRASSQRRADASGSGSGSGKHRGPIIDVRSYKPADGSASWGDELLLEPLYDSSMAAFIFKPPLDARQRGLLVVS